jgi:hypothetical protein
MLQVAMDRFQTVDWTPAAIEAALEEVRLTHGWSKESLYTPIRESVAGSVSSPIEHTLAAQSEALARVRRVLR